MNLRMIYNKKGIGFLGVCVLITVSFIFQDMSGAAIHLSHKAILITIMYFIIALASDDYAGIEDMINRVWAYSKSKQDANMKLQLIKSFINVNVAKWHKYWVMYQKVCKPEMYKPEKYEKLKDFLLRIPRGTVSFKQFLWIMAYVSYNLFRSSIFTFVNNDIDFLIDLFGIGFFMFTSGSVIGMNYFMANMFDAIKPSANDIETVEYSLSLLESQIIYGARQYGFTSEILKDLATMNEEVEPKPKKETKKKKEEKK